MLLLLYLRYIFLVGCCTCAPDSFVIVFFWVHGTDVSIGVWLESGESLLQEENSTGYIIGETQTHIFADSMAIAESVLNHYAT